MTNPYNWNIPWYQNWSPQTWPVPSLTPQQMQAATEFGQLLQQGKNPMEELKQAQNKLAEYEKQNAKDLTSQLLATPMGQTYLDLRRDGIIEILLKQALQNPMTQVETQAFLDKWTEKAQAYLNEQS